MKFYKLSDTKTNTIMKKLLLLSAILTSPFSFTQDLSSVFEDVKYRNIGPFRGGRSVSSVWVLDNPQTYYMGTVGGGLWKTTNSGGEWFNISDDYFKTSSVGAIAVAESDSKIIYENKGKKDNREIKNQTMSGAIIKALTLWNNHLRDAFIRLILYRSSTKQ